jgi:hypothetical protein
MTVFLAISYRQPALPCYARLTQKSARDCKVGLVVVDPQNDFLSLAGATLGLVGESMIENGSVGHRGCCLSRSKSEGFR